MKTRSVAVLAALAVATVACSSGADTASHAPNSTSARSVEAASNSGAAPSAVPAVSAAETDGGAVSDYDEAPRAPDTVVTDVPSNPVTYPAVDPLSTFAMDVDTGSYTYVRGSLNNGVVPSPDVVRVEEFINALDQDYAAPTDSDFALTIDGTAAPFLAPGTRVVRIGIQGREVDDSARQDANLTFVIDISGSMGDPGKLDAVKPALSALVESLRPTDRVGIVVYSDDTRVVLESTPVSERAAINDAIDQLQVEGSTNVEQGLRLGYAQAQSGFDDNRINRVILLSDGVANVGETGPEGILGVIGDAARDGIDLVTVGFGLGDYNDRLMEQLADQGDGFYAYVDGEREAVRLFSHDLTGTLVTIAEQAKVQVEFNPVAVATYRLIGFENRAVADEDFRDDSVDGGEIGAGHTVTALYEVTLHAGGEQSTSADSAESDWLVRGTIRWLDPSTEMPSELTTTLAGDAVATSIGDVSLRLQQDIYVAAFAETLRGTGWDGLVSLEGLSQNLHSLATRLGDDALAETAALVDIRAGLG